MLFTPLHHLAAHAGSPEQQDGGSNARRRPIRTGATMLLAGWLSGLPNPIRYPAALVTAEYVRGLKGGVSDFDRR